MKNIKKFFRFVFVYKPLREYQAHATRWQTIKYHSLNGIRRVIMLVIFAGVCTGSYYLGSYLNPIRVEAEKIVEVPSKTLPPVLKRIMQCESGGTQFDKNGQVLMHANSNGSVDAGIMQINLTIWGKQAKLMGYDLTKESDNTEFGKWLFENYGDAPWSASSKCWAK